MKSIVKKLVIYSMAGIMQISFGAGIASASPIFIGPQQIVRLDEGPHNRDNDRQREHDRRMQEENERHEREMQRRRGESDREWHERQERERHRHDEALNQIAALLIGIAIGSSNN
ncbi:Hypothetical protein LUCI_2174 [Lucifera butyrica]|uniref:Uncharacterized protein n=1 Tax=Lucifera butyrica TaxID=1351585 RepID=A0A498R9J0_9FIRM|nr:hypothetical protein [Lucifera butyrica]VBB06932.1 Hypothetical protein LUCI_2174 [Lucifera butyrica]